MATTTTTTTAPTTSATDLDMQAGYGAFGTECWACGGGAETEGHVQEDMEAVPLCLGCAEAHRHGMRWPVF